MEYIKTNEGQYLDKNGFITCPVCGRKKSALRNDGDLRAKVHCNCKTGNHHTVFNLDMDVYTYINRYGDCLVIL